MLRRRGRSSSSSGLGRGLFLRYVWEAIGLTSLLFVPIGTAAVISPVDRIGYLGEDVHLPTGADGMGPVSRPIWKQLVGIQMGTIAHEWNVVVTE